MSAVDAEPAEAGALVPVPPEGLAAPAAEAAEGSPAPPWRNRIVRYGEEAPERLRPHARNWRRHPQGQLEALAGVLSEVGFVQGVILNEQTGNVVDGHARIELAIRRNEPTVPVTYVDLSPEEEAAVLATFDPLGALATADALALDGLLRDVRTGDAAVERLLSDLARRNGLAAGDAPAAPDSFRAFGEDLPCDFRCPKCGYEWSGRAR